MHRPILISVLTAAFLVAPVARAEPPDAVVGELQRLNGAVERVALLMERLVDERRVEALQRQLAIENDRLGPIEERLAAEREALRAVQAREVELLGARENLSKPLEGTFDSELFRQQRKLKLAENETELAAVRTELAERERMIRDLEAEAAGLRDRKATLAREIDDRLGLAP
jgi:chromosome segregation ATPase